MRKVYIISIIIGAIALASGATFSYFNDLESSTNNQLQAASLDLKVSSHAYFNGAENATSTWLAKDLTSGDLLYDFSNLKPGDWGENTIDLKLGANDINAFVCMDLNLIENNENGITGPEVAQGEILGKTDGDLPDYAQFIFWADNGNNVFESSETGSVIAEGSASSLFNGSHRTLADASYNVWTGARDPILPGLTYNIGQAWCLGALTTAPVPMGEATSPTVDSGLRCNGQNISDINKAQTDSMKASIKFMAFQEAGNSSFICADLP